jgi:cell division protein FtsW (lipid II flippase)
MRMRRFSVGSIWKSTRPALVSRLITMLAIGSGGWTGLGLGMAAKIGGAEHHTDFIFRLSVKSWDWRQLSWFLHS